ncbi:MAG TPA: hypothetical protein VFP72_19520 [Kineosporiaceae bacterium]|nr:hypothetical protein [Kineosporiaceae bacterium]
MIRWQLLRRAAQRPAGPERIGRRWTGRALALLVVAAPVAVLAPSAAQASGPAAVAVPSCGITWGSLEKTVTTSVPPTVNSVVRGVRAGRHDCYDRLVIDLSGPVSTVRVFYTAQVRMDGSGLAVPLRGGAKLQIVVSAPSYDAAYRPTYRPANPRELVAVTGYRTFRQVASAGSFEGWSTFGLGVRARLPMRALLLPGPGTGARLVVDVAHHW